MPDQPPLSDDELQAIEKRTKARWCYRSGDPSELDDLLACVAEVRRLNAELTTQGILLTAAKCSYGIADIERDKAEAELRAVRAAVTEESQRADRLSEEMATAQRVSARQQRALDWLIRRYSKHRQRADKYKASDHASYVKLQAVREILDVDGCEEDVPRLAKRAIEAARELRDFITKWQGFISMSGGGSIETDEILERTDWLSTGGNDGPAV